MNLPELQSKAVPEIDPDLNGFFINRIVCASRPAHFSSGLQRPAGKACRASNVAVVDIRPYIIVVFMFEIPVDGEMKIRVKSEHGSEDRFMVPSGAAPDEVSPFEQRANILTKYFPGASGPIPGLTWEV